MTYTPFQKYLIESLPKNGPGVHDDPGPYYDPILGIEKDPGDMGGGDNTDGGGEPPVTIPENIPTANLLVYQIVEMFMENLNWIPGPWPAGWDANHTRFFLVRLIGMTENNNQMYLILLQLLSGMGQPGGKYGDGSVWDYPDEWSDDLPMVDRMMLFYQILALAWQDAVADDWSWMMNSINVFREWLHGIFMKHGASQGVDEDDLPDWFWDEWGEENPPHNIP